jgi:hypothetical protein
MDLDFNFNEWAFLAQTNPEGFERCREQYIGQFIRASGRHRRRLEALQSRIDVERELAPSPEAALAMISGQMCASLSQLVTEMQDLKTLLPAPSASCPARAGKRRSVRQR